MASGEDNGTWYGDSNMIVDKSALREMSSSARGSRSTQKSRQTTDSKEGDDT